MPFIVAGAVSGHVGDEVKDDNDDVIFANLETLLAYSMLAMNLLYLGLNASALNILGCKTHSTN